MESTNMRDRVVRRAAELVIINRRSALDALETAMDEFQVDDDVAIDDFLRPLEARVEAANKKKGSEKDPDAAALARATKAMDAIVLGIGRASGPASGRPGEVDADEEDVVWRTGSPTKSSSWTRTLDIMDILERRVKDATSTAPGVHGIAR